MSATINPHWTDTDDRIRVSWNYYMIASGGVFKQVGLIRLRFSIDLPTAQTNHAFVCIKVCLCNTHNIRVWNTSNTVETLLNCSFYKLRAEVLWLQLQNRQKRASLNTQHVEPWSRWTTATEHTHRCHSCQMRTAGNRLQFTRAHQNWTIEDWNCSQFFCNIQMGVRIWHKQYESMDTSCLVSTVQAGTCAWCNGVGICLFLAHFGPFCNNLASFKHHSLPKYCCWPCPSIHDTVYRPFHKM